MSTTKYKPPSKKRKKGLFHGNRFTQARKSPVAADSSQGSTADGNVEKETVDASALKLLLLASESDNCSSDGSDCSTSESDGECDENDLCTSRRIIDLAPLQDLIRTAAVCRECGVGDLDLQESSRSGLASHVSLVCSNCKAETSSVLAKKSEKGKFYEINRQAVFAARCIGKGKQGLTTLCSALSMPKPMANNAFDCHRRALASASEVVLKKCLDQAASHLQSGDEPADVAVTVDGTWMRRGFSSLYGIVFVIAWETGQVLDFCVLSRHCHACKLWAAKRRNETISQNVWQAWKDAHASTCSNTTNSSAPAMEAEGARILFGRSLERKLRYTTYIGDGDSKGFVAVSQDDPYDGIPITKAECIGHIQKRVGKGLRDLKKSRGKEKLADGKPLNGKGRLSDTLIDTLQNYYGMAVREGCKAGDDETGIARRIYASLFHRASSDNKPQHMFCPPGADSFCGWQRMKAGAQESYEHHDPIPDAVVEEIKPVYLRLTDKALLTRCLRGATQNRNESLNGMVWQHCPKESFCGLGTVSTAAALATIKFNAGSAKLSALLEEMGCSSGGQDAVSFAATDQFRIRNSKRKNSSQEKKERKRRRRVKKGYEEDLIDEEGVSYETGAF